MVVSSHVVEFKDNDEVDPARFEFNGTVHRNRCDSHLESLLKQSNISKGIINSNIGPSYAGEFEDNDEDDSACDEESEVVYCDIKQNMKCFERLFFHGGSPLFCVTVSDRNLHDSVSSVFSVFEANISYNTAI